MSQINLKKTLSTLAQFVPVHIRSSPGLVLAGRARNDEINKRRAKFNLGFVLYQLGYHSSYRTHSLWVFKFVYESLDRRIALTSRHEIRQFFKQLKLTLVDLIMELGFNDDTERGQMLFTNDLYSLIKFANETLTQLGAFTLELPVEEVDY